MNIQGNNQEASHMKRRRRFIKKTEANLSNYIPHPNTINTTNTVMHKSLGYTIKLDSIAGFKKSFVDNKIPLDKNFFVRYTLTFLSKKDKAQFYGNTYCSRLIAISFNSNNEIELREKDPILIYFLTYENETLDIALEITLITATLHQVILDTEVLGWCLLNPEEVNGLDTIKINSNIYLGSCRLLQYKDIKDCASVPGASLNHAGQLTPQLETIAFLIPHYVFIGDNIEIPGLLFRYLPKNETSGAIKLIPFLDVFIKNIEIAIHNDIERDVIAQAQLYRQKREPNGNNQPLSIMQRQLKCYLHNTWKGINIDNRNDIIPLQQRGSFLFFNATHKLNKYIIDEAGLCAFVTDLQYVLSIPFQNSIEDHVFTLGTAIFIPETIDNFNTFQSAYFATGPGNTLGGDDMLEIKIAPMKVNFILSKNKDLADGSFKENEYDSLNKKIEDIRQSLITENTQAVMNKDGNGDRKVKDLENEMKSLIEKRDDTQKEIKDIYNRSPKASNREDPMMNNRELMNTQFIIDASQQPTQIPAINVEPNNINENDRPLPGANDMVNTGMDMTMGSFYDPSKQVPPQQQQQKPMQPQPQLSYFDEEAKRYEEYIAFKDKSQQSNPSSSYIKPPPIKVNDQNIIYENDGRDISRKDQSELASKGIIALNQEEQNPSLSQFTIEKEISPTQVNFAHSFTFHFSAFKPNKNIKSYNEIPSLIQFKFSFWDFESFTSSIATIAKPNVNIVPSSAPMVIIKEDASLSAKSEEKEMKVTITFDPSVDNYFDYKDFINYLLLRQLFVQVYNAESQIEIGFIRIPLKNLLRQGRSTLFNQEECEIYNSSFDNYGAIQILLRSNEQKTFKEYKYDRNAFRLFNTKENAVQLKKKKVVSVNPYDANSINQKEKEFYTKTILSQKNNSMAQTYNNSNQPGMAMSMNSNANFVMNQTTNDKLFHNRIRLNPEVEKRVRVMRYFNQGDPNSIKIPEEAIHEQRIKLENETTFHKTLNYANQLKQMNKNDVLQQTIRENDKNFMNIALVAGHPHFFNYVIFNDSSKDELYHVIISTGKENTQTIDETISIITDAGQWERIAMENKLAIPSDYNCLSKDYYLIMKPYETIPLLVRLLSFDKKINAPYTIWIQRKNGSPLSFLTVTIVKVFPIIDHVFTYNIPMNKFHHVKFLNPFKFNRAKTSRILENMILSDKSISVKLDSATNDFYFKVKSPEKDETWEMLAFLYLDSDRRILYATWKFEICSKESIDVYTNVGVRLTQKINLEPDNLPRTIQFFSSNINTLSFPEKYSSPIVLVPRMRYDISYVLFSKKAEAEDILINCVDISSRELIRSWLIKNSPMKPSITQSLRIECRLNCVNSVKFEYINPLNNWAILRFESSNKDYLELVEDQISFNCEEKKLISVNMRSQNEPCSAMVYVFVSDVDEIFNQTILFQLNYS